MKPPPSTPAPRKFLLPKRAPPSQSQSTPRFGPPSSTPRFTQRKTIEDVDDEDDDDDDDDDGRSQGSSDGDGGLREGRRRADVKGDAIEIASSMSRDEVAESASEPEDERLDSTEKGVVDVDIESSSMNSSPTEREAKRRKLSITPLPAFTSPSNEHQGLSPVGIEEKKPQEHLEDLSLESTASDYDEEETLADNDAQPKAPQQPTFQPPPRFKLAEDAEPLGEGLPAAFSPQRKGAKYLTGGLAAELQSWLSEVKGEDGPTGSTFRLSVEEIRSGQRMYLVHGRVDHNSEMRKVILAGEGKLTGLGKRAVVGVGSMVEIGQPVWDVELEGEMWTVACDWTVP